ncbi:THO complex subunit 4D [Morella rubra]|uniref:THO complex subunit 4D n=1 Tax=Morella rubra TaxID=262757 RepID=A0A6A1VGK9_9ROSI|nr:THO complex subunit 4D [Morella rubra]
MAEKFKSQTESVLNLPSHYVNAVGSAEVVYTRRSDAFAALKRYNNVLLDGKPMRIEIVGSNAEMPLSARVNVTGSESSWGNKWPWGYKWPGRGRGRGRGGRGRGRGRGRENNQPVEMSIDDLNDDLENYHAEAKNT